MDYSFLVGVERNQRQKIKNAMREEFILDTIY